MIISRSNLDIVLSVFLFVEPFVLGWNPPYLDTCEAIYGHYLLSGTTVKHCTARQQKNGPKAAYWMIADCHNWGDAETECQRAGGHLAALSSFKDKVYLQRFLSPLVVGGGTCFASSYSLYLYGLWIGLSRPNSSTNEWQWTNSTTEASVDLPFNQYSTYYETSQIVSAGNCGLAARSTSWHGYIANSQKGYRMAACSTSAPALCMKIL